MSTQLICDNPACTSGAGGTPKAETLATFPPPLRITPPDGWQQVVLLDSVTGRPVVKWCCCPACVTAVIGG